ncbi:hypothetical protein OIV83_006049 [Microbotryomycetes sp. JL201]|nr:hypothetical protein OIV83_006049 [Microbotryomycetes sp. JL201]
MASYPPQQQHAEYGTPGSYGVPPAGGQPHMQQPEKTAPMTANAAGMAPGGDPSQQQQQVHVQSNAPREWSTAFENWH